MSNKKGFAIIHTHVGESLFKNGTLNQMFIERINYLNSKNGIQPLQGY